MKKGWLKPFLPRSLYGRAAMILLVPVVTIQLVVSIAFLQRHFEGVTRQMTANLVLEIGYLLAQVDASNSLEAAQAEAKALVAPLALKLELPAIGDEEDAVDQRLYYDFSGREVIATLREGLLGVTAVDLLQSSREVRILIETRHGPMRVVLDRRRVSASNPHQLLVLMIATSFLMTMIAYLFLRNQLRPITRLAEAAEAFGKGRSLPYRPRGATEVRAAGNAFLDMRGRIERAIEQRTLMLSGVSHDLRTPLTRLRLGLTMLEDEREAEALLRDVGDMERLLDAFLSFARGDAMEDAEECDPVALVRRVVDNARRGGQNVEIVEVSGEGKVMLRPQAIERALENLLSNAARHATRAEVSVSIGERSVRISVEDDGPGIPKERREEALRPFTRLDAARNPNRGGGVGLGLSIAADIARSHGGVLQLGEGTRLGGLLAKLVLAR